ncbi:MAG: helix-turn-helix transcriptional regulator [Proteobacteria bacterium]|nr:helix-turn-helix transcriptional regulator [Pseudomonadota bacterium]
MKGAGERLRERARQLGLSDAEVARRIGISARTYNHYVNNKREPDFQKLLRIAQILGVTPNQVLGLSPLAADGPVPADEFAQVPVYDIRAAAGDGQWIDDEHVKHLVVFRRQWLRTVTTAPLDKLVVIEADGQSMAPTINDGDNMLVDLTQTAPRRDGIYVIRLDGDVMVKRITIDPVRRLAKITSDNPLHAPLDPVPLNELHIAGRVIWLGRRI